MDKLYTGDIPQEYHFATFGNNYIDLYNTDTIEPNNNYDFYRIYLYDNLFFYEQMQNNTQYNTETYYNTSLETTDNEMYRRDFPSILTCVFIIAFFLIWLTNALTSIIRKGGVLGGLT